MNELSKTAIKNSTRRRWSLKALLLQFGFEPAGGQRNFWTRYAGQLEWIYRDCFINYRKQAARAHPDTGGSHDSSAQLNARWTELKRRFQQNCHELAVPWTLEDEAPRERKRREAEYHFDMPSVFKAARELGVSGAAIRERVRMGWTLEKAMTEPLRPRGRRACHTVRRVATVVALTASLICVKAAEPFRLAETTAARLTNAVACIISWDPVPPQFEVVHYEVYQSEAVTGPYLLISQTDTNEITLVVESGTHFWNIRAISIWNGTNRVSDPSASVGMLDTPAKGTSVKPVKPPKPHAAIPDALLVPMGMSMPVPAGETNQVFTRARSVPTRVPPIK